jgi:hypothetical protein
MAGGWWPVPDELKVWCDDDHRLRIELRLPAGGSAQATNIRCGSSYCDVKARMGRDALTVVVWARVGPPVWTTLEAVLPMPPAATEVDGQSLRAQVMPEGDGVRAVLSFQAGAETEVRFISATSHQPPATSP